jgi:hypothetical protein
MQHQLRLSLRLWRRLAPLPRLGLWRLHLALGPSGGLLPAGLLDLGQRNGGICTER